MNTQEHKGEKSSVIFEGERHRPASRVETRLHQNVLTRQDHEPNLRAAHIRMLQMRHTAIALQASVSTTRSGQRKKTDLCPRDVGNVQVPVVLHLIQVASIHLVRLELQRHWARTVSTPDETNAIRRSPRCARADTWASLSTHQSGL